MVFGLMRTCRIQWWDSLFSVFNWMLYPFSESLVQKIKIVSLSWYLIPRLIPFLFWTGSIFFGGKNLFRKINTLCWSKNLEPGIIPMSKIRWSCSIFCFRPYFGCLPKKTIWHFHVTWLISQHVTQRDSKSVVFLFVTFFSFTLNVLIEIKKQEIVIGWQKTYNHSQNI